MPAGFLEPFGKLIRTLGVRGRTMSKQFQNFMLGLGAVILGVLLISAIVEKDSTKEGPGGKVGASTRVLNLAYQFSPGSMFNHDLYVTNTCGEDLSEVRIRFQFVGENGSPVIDRYWSTWNLGEKQQVQVPVDRVANVQRIVVSGNADQGSFSADLGPQ